LPEEIEINAILAAAAMNFQKLLRAFWRYFSVLPGAGMERLDSISKARKIEMLSLQYVPENHFFRIDY